MDKYTKQERLQGWLDWKTQWLKDAETLLNALISDQFFCEDWEVKKALGESYSEPYIWKPESVVDYQERRKTSLKESYLKDFPEEAAEFLSKVPEHLVWKSFGIILEKPSEENKEKLMKMLNEKEKNRTMFNDPLIPGLFLQSLCFSCNEVNLDPEVLKPVLKAQYNYWLDYIESGIKVCEQLKNGKDIAHIDDEPGDDELHKNALNMLYYAATKFQVVNNALFIFGHDEEQFLKGLKYLEYYEKEL